MFILKKKKEEKNEGNGGKKDKACETEDYHRWSHIFGGEDQTEEKQAGNEKRTQTRTLIHVDKTEERIKRMIRSEEDQKKKMCENMYEKSARVIKNEKRRQKIMDRKQEMKGWKELLKEGRKRFEERMRKQQGKRVATIEEKIEERLQMDKQE